MTDAEDNSQSPAEDRPAPRPDVAAGAAPRLDVAAGAAPRLDVAAGAAPRTHVSVPELREWMRNWVANATNTSPDSVNESAPLIELGMASRDAVAMASDIEDYTGVVVTATMAFRHPTIESLATVIVEGEPEVEDAGDEDWSREVDEGRANIA